MYFTSVFFCNNSLLFNLHLIYFMGFFVVVGTANNKLSSYN